MTYNVFSGTLNLAVSIYFGSREAEGLDASYLRQ